MEGKRKGLKNLGGERKKMENNKIAAILIATIMMMAIIAPAMATNSDANSVYKSSTCPVCPNKDANVSAIELQGIEKNEAIAKALKDEEFIKLKSVLAESGHAPQLGSATVAKIISEYSSATYVYLPFKAKDDPGFGGLGYIITEDGCRALATDFYEVNGETFVKIYYIDSNGEVVVEIRGVDWECWASCMALECSPPLPGPCVLCWELLTICVNAPNPITCGAAATCFGAFGLYCTWQCWS